VSENKSTSSKKSLPFRAASTNPSTSSSSEPVACQDDGELTESVYDFEYDPQSKTGHELLASNPEAGPAWYKLETVLPDLMDADGFEKLKLIKEAVRDQIMVAYKQSQTERQKVIDSEGRAEERTGELIDRTLSKNPAEWKTRMVALKGPVEADQIKDNIEALKTLLCDILSGTSELKKKLMEVNYQLELYEVMETAT
jgi:hypothetical protein